ncbi:hypothetical protein D5085_02760 [Ectothiorhodospiraceae bacterium BW-2]|nr:hypothetical protein D5085_02760 [Ectothiorhodospiraceae bacterium BW-2]
MSNTIDSRDDSRDHVQRRVNQSRGLLALLMAADIKDANPEAIESSLLLADELLAEVQQIIEG